MAHRSRWLPVRSSWAMCVGLALAGTLAASTSRAAASERRLTPTVKIVQQARPSIVNIHGQKTITPSDENYRRGEAPHNVNGMGTGVIIDERGYILTNFHVVDGVREIQVTLADDRTLVATLESHDTTTDLAVIRITSSAKLPVINIGTSDDLMPGEPVIAVGNAYGYTHTVTCGIISALHRVVQVSDAQKYEDLIQTDASINPGNSGGPLLNADGEMIGINVAVRAGAQGIGFAIPVDLAMNVAAELMSAQRIGETWHGIVPKMLGNTGARRLVVGDVDDESPAAKCGLQRGDVITAVGNSPVARPLDLERALLGRKPGEEVQLTVHRNKQAVQVSLVLASAPKRSATTGDDTWQVIGLRLEPVAASRFEQFKTHYRGGLLVTDVRPNSPASRQGIRSGDVLVGMHIWETVSLENVEYVLKRIDVTTLDPLKFYILRDDGEYYGTYYGHMSLTARR
ncbi:MAG: trypsin-like peptidase domain-containing protein [Pirellulales bacterium]